MANVSDYLKPISLNNQPCMIRLILIDVNSDEYKQGLHYYQFMANLE